MEGLSFEQTPSAPVPAPARQKSRKRFFMLLAGIIIVILIIFAGTKILGSKGNKTTAEITPTPTQEILTETPTETPTASPTATTTPTPTSTPTPKPSANPVDSATGLDRSKLGVAVQNGSGVTGAAAKAADFLKGLGYDIVSTGNAATEDFTNVTIQVKSTKASFLSLLKKDLSTNYTVGSTSSDLDASSSADALVVIGK